MSKLRADSTWNELTPEQLERLEEWLFAENVSFREAQERVQREFGLTSTVSSVVRFYRRVETERAREQMAEGFVAAEQVNGTEGKLECLRSSSLRLIGARLQREAMGNGEARDLASLGHLLLESQEREIQQGRLELARKRFEFNAAQAALEVAPLLEEISRDETERELARIEKVRRQLFGEPPEKKE